MMSLDFLFKIFCLELVTCFFGKLISILILNIVYVHLKKSHKKAVVLCHYKIIKVIY